MPKERKDRSVSQDSSRTSPYPSSSSRVRRSTSKTPLESEENIKEWEEARCPVCMEHPHNAVLLICSSHEKGCRPYMCNTSYRHSNCLDQFCKSFAEPSPPTIPLVESEISNSDSPQDQPQDSTEANIVDVQEETSEGFVTMQSLSCEDETKSKLVCPLCRGQIKEWKVMDGARHFMNEKSRSCSCESCNFTGTYTDLRKHARVDHPLERPSAVDPERQRNWRRLERQRDLGDLLSTLQNSFGENRADDGLGLAPIDDGGLLAVFFLILQPSSVSRGTTGTRLQMRIRRPSRLWGENYEAESGSATRDRDDTTNESSDGGSDNRRRRVRRRIQTPDRQP
ncbi:unnamed protein product [Vicia faba]|uniref:Zinc finger, RING/FYVE/PHD-type n=1 Tax=Vicia faba TaxID=3906 RepID=A0AAV1AIU6_VICFA|nr:unnamed protein product [Vicia faba]